MTELAQNLNVTIINMCNDAKANMNLMRRKWEIEKFLECQNVKNVVRSKFNFYK